MTANASPANILVAGIYWSGSGAVVDYLKGHPDCVAFRGEFTDFKRHGRIASMLSAPDRASARRMARLLWIETVFGRLPQAYLKQWRGADTGKLPLKNQVHHNRLKRDYINRYRRHLARGGDHRDPAIWNDWMHALGTAYAPGKRAVVWDQPVWVGEHADIWPQVFAPVRLIVVHRDLQDQFAEVVRQGKLGKRKSDPAFQGDMSDPVAYVLDGIQRKLESLLALREQLGESLVLPVSFESFVQRHEREAERIGRFLGLNNAQREGAPFDPSKSVRNIGIGRTEEIQSLLAPHRERLAVMQALRDRL
ncbi:sulfotransferase [Marinobacter sp. JSM 1782161]|uniref:sulfotransferase n=1 Tax=Marinobacter sp. JSM 1782161 TaxID=2685906 RepID=UPI00140273DE|nr:sulfotransferase [Marinobacter sp. JSM 1782161]